MGTSSKNASLKVRTQAKFAPSTLANATHVFASPPGAPLPAQTHSEVAFIGRSNVGKSSLINGLLGRKNLARTSNTPGATRAIHFYDVGGVFTLVDLPGYGYAKISKTDSEALADHVRAYLQERSSLKVVCVLVDMRHGLKDSDQAMIEELAQNGLPCYIVLTKADKLKAKQQQAAWEHITTQTQALVGPLTDPIMTAAEKNIGMDTLQSHLCGQLNL